VIYLFTGGFAVFICYNKRVESVIEVRALSKTFGDFAAVDGISFSVSEGEFFGFVGPNGAGKTTTINMLCTLVAPSSGSASVAGFDVAAEPAKVRDMIGVVFQEATLDNRLTCRENLEFHAAVYHIPKTERAVRISDVLALVELSDFANDIVDNFSGGMKRRLEVARGLMHKPKVLFMDEPTLGLDPQTRNRIWDYLRDSEGGKTSVFMTTHYMDEAENCDRVAIIDRGKIVAIGSPADLKQQTGQDSMDGVFLSLTGSKIRGDDATPGRHMSHIAAKAKGGR
jgi:ABC-2 type transport system ATP-binding protein